MCIRISPCLDACAFAEAERIIRLYAVELEIDLGFQNFEEEVSDLPAQYAAPTGGMLLAMRGEGPVGCVGVRKVAGDIAELKRLYVMPAARGTGLGRQLAVAAIKLAAQLGYQRIRLDTLPSMTQANQLYRSLGFRQIAPYRHNPVPGTRYFEKTIEASE